ncbi:hypothetical protein ACFL3T_01440 [Patescibacteria group bacterium]
MRVKAWGTRGSIAVSNPDSVHFGGNTTCYEIISECLPPNTKFVVDAGTGFVPCGLHYLDEVKNGLKYIVAFSHWHWDHILGLTLSPPTFIEQVEMSLFGPRDEGVGPQEMLKHLFKRPFFPVDAKKIGHKTACKTLDDFDVHVMVVHPVGGVATFAVDRFRTLIEADKQLPFGKSNFGVEECLVIRMTPAHHGDAMTISYRFEERPTGKVLAILTDNEDEVGAPPDLRAHLIGADLAIMDAQYTLKRLLLMTGRYGHGSPTGVVKLALICGLGRIKLTHHDPQSTDAQLKKVMLAEANAALERYGKDEEFLELFGIDEIRLTPEGIGLCRDYEEYDV